MREQRPYQRAILFALTVLALCAVCFPSRAAADARCPFVIWKKPIKPDASISTSPDGTFFGVVAPNGEITCYDLKGNLAWRNTFDGMTDLAIGHGGKSLIAFTKGDDDHRRVYLLNRRGGVIWRYRPRSAIVCAGVSKSGRHGAFGTQDGYVYLCSFTRERPRYRRWRLPGIPVSISFSPDGNRLIVGQRNSGGVGAYTTRGQPVWLAEGDPKKVYSARYCATGGYVLYHGLSPEGEESHLGILGPDGKLVWSLVLGGKEATATISYPGDYVAYGFSRDVAHKSQSARSRFVRLYSLSGKRLWEQGGMLFKPFLVSLTPSGLALVHDGRKSLAILDINGRRIGHLAMPANIRRCAPAPNSGRSLVYCGDGWLYLVYAGG